MLYNYIRPNYFRPFSADENIFTTKKANYGNGTISVANHRTSTLGHLRKLFAQNFSTYSDMEAYSRQVETGARVATMLIERSVRQLLENFLCERELENSADWYRRMGNFHGQRIFAVFAVAVDREIKLCEI